MLTNVDAVPNVEKDDEQFGTETLSNWPVPSNAADSVSRHENNAKPVAFW